MNQPGLALFLAAVLGIPGAATQSGTVQGPPPDKVDPIVLPPVTVTAQKEPADVLRLPVSVTVVRADWLQLGSTVSDAGIYSPNTYFSEFTARKLTNPRFRGIGASPANPSVTTFVDGVPLLNANASNIELMDVDQIEFVRGPQSALFGRNTLAGLINVASARPSLTRWSGQLAVPVGSYSAREVRGAASGPLGDTVAFGASIGHARRDGFTENDLTSNDLDYREATSGKAQLLWTPAAHWEARVIVSAERARDGDYALSDLGGLRQSRYRTARDFEGRTDRDIFSTAVLTRREGSRFVFSTTTGVVRWKTQDVTDLDYRPLPLINRDNAEEAVQFTQEARLASATAAPLALTDRVALAWQAGAFVFTQNYEQLAINSYGPFVLSEFIDFPVSQTAPEADLDDLGVSVYGQGTFTIGERLDLTAGARFDRETKDARLNSSFSPMIFPSSAVDTDATFSTVSPQFAVAYRLRPNHTVYASAARGFKAGGFNPSSPAGSEAYGEEFAWHAEGGVKSAAMNGRLRFGAAAFWIDWQDLQLNLPNTQSPGQFFIANVGSASSRGLELEVNARAHRDVDLFGSFGYTHARFGDGTSSNGADVSDKTIPNTPDYTAAFGARLSRSLTPAATLYGHGEIVFYGAFTYDDANLAGQEAYSLANLRGGIRGKYLFAEGWIRNAFDSAYVPVAFAFPLAPSGFLGESGRPRTFGITFGSRF
ncbi:MAG TPA: TonB-dependent receptor [Vicinamibacterales bacterium]|nr:TonB-dependent receptor [Vicinamibacterales bacterium]